MIMLLYCTDADKLLILDMTPLESWTLLPSTLLYPATEDTTRLALNPRCSLNVLPCFSTVPSFNQIWQNFTIYLSISAWLAGNVGDLLQRELNSQGMEWGKVQVRIEDSSSCVSSSPGNKLVSMLSRLLKTSFRFKFWIDKVEFRFRFKWSFLDKQGSILNKRMAWFWVVTEQQLKCRQMKKKYKMTIVLC